VSSNWPSVKLTEVCSPKQWPTIPKTDFTKEGYPVFGANGQIGFYKDYNHEHETVLVTCRGATCGSINICPPRSYVTGNAMALDNLNTARIDMMFLYHLLKKRGLADVISGSAQPQITRQGLDSVKFDLPPIEEQRRIAAILDKANSIRRKREQSLALADDLLRATFLDMFGDFGVNQKAFPEVEIGDVVSEVRDGPHVSPEYADEGIPILSTRNIRPATLVLEDLKYVTQDNYDFLTRIFKPQKGDVLLTKGGTTGFAKAVDFHWPFAIWVHLACLRPTKEVLPAFLETALNTKWCYEQSQKYTRGITNKDLGLTRIKKIKILLPPKSLQLAFEKTYSRRIALKKKLNAEVILSEKLVASLSQRAFRGEL
jgi:type I restriction enzyme, S subunit